MNHKILRLLLKLFPRKEKFFVNPVYPVYYKHAIKKSQPDKRDLNYAQSIFDVLPESASISKFLPPVKNQGNIGSCGSFAAISCFETLQKIQNPEWDIELSELFHYWVVRQKDCLGKNYMGTFPRDSGQNGRDAMRVLANVGATPEKLWPYNTNKFNDKPDYLASSVARFNRLPEYNSCFSVDSIKSAIVDKKPVWIGIPINDDFRKYRGGVFNTFSTPIGGHAMEVCEYDDKDQALRMFNSWDLDWGENGFGWISHKYVKTAKWPSGTAGFEAWALNSISHTEKE